MDPRDPLADFLFRKKEGWCEYFATSAAILLRTQGIAARYVYGFNVIGSQRKGDYYLVRDWDRHAWIEAYIEGKGWIEYDPTPAAEYESLHAGLDRGFWTDGMEWLSAQLTNLYVRLPHIDKGNVAWALGLLVFVYFLARILRRLRQRVKTKKTRETSSPSTGIEHLVSRLDRLAAELGCPRSRSTPPLEHWMGIPRDRLDDGPREAGLRILESYYRARFGSIPISPNEAEGLERSLHRLVSRK